MMENDGGKLGIEDKSWQNDKVHKNLSEADQDKDENIQAAQARTREKFLVCGSLAGCDKKDLVIWPKILKMIVLLVMMNAPQLCTKHVNIQ